MKDRLAGTLAPPALIPAIGLARWGERPREPLGFLNAGMAGRVEALLQTLVALGQARRLEDGRYTAG